MGILARLGRSPRVARRAEHGDLGGGPRLEPIEDAQDCLGEDLELLLLAGGDLERVRCRQLLQLVEIGPPEHVGSYSFQNGRCTQPCSIGLIV